MLGRLPVVVDAKTGRSLICGRMAVAEREVRRCLELSQEEVARHAGVSLRTIRYLEKGRAIPKIETLERIARGLGLSFSDLGYVADRLPAQAREIIVRAGNGNSLP